MKHHPSRLRVGLGIAAAGLLAIPTAAAATLPGVGTFDFWSWTTLLLLVGALGLVSLAGGAGRAFVHKWPMGKVIAGGGLVVAVAAVLLAAAITPGGFLTGSFGSANAASSGAAGLGGSYDPALHEATSDVTFYAVDAETQTAINPAVAIYEAGSVTEKQAFEGSATALYSGTMSSGSLTISGIQTQTIGCTVDVGVNLANYYEDLITGVNICVAKNALGNNDLSVPSFGLEKIGTNSLGLSGTTYSCADSTQCTYSLILKNSVADTFLRAPAVKFSTGNTAYSLDSVDSGDCEIVEVSSTQYVKYTGNAANIEGLDVVTCQVLITNNAVTGGTFNLTADDHFMAYGASAWNTNANIRGASATAAVEVSEAA